MQVFLSRNWYLVFFIYGLAFFLMGFAIAFQARRPSSFYLARHLCSLAVFGLLHGTAEWAYIFIPSPGVKTGLDIRLRANTPEKIRTRNRWEGPTPPVKIRVN